MTKKQQKAVRLELRAGGDFHESENLELIASDMEK